ncbi:MAG: hypothetical protein ACYTGX_04655 [Planctomycetota bacterium]|jgi:hypothetical protein
MSEPTLEERAAYRRWKKAFKPPKWIRRPAMWVLAAAGLAIVGYEAFRAIQQLTGSGGA